MLESQQGVRLMADVERRYKDTLFKHIFKENRHFLDLYEVCAGQRLEVDSIICFDLDSDIVKRDRYNDVSFMTADNRLIYMIEHQSTANANLAVKMGAYYFDLLGWRESNPTCFRLADFAPA